MTLREACVDKSIRYKLRSLREYIELGYTPNHELQAKVWQIEDVIRRGMLSPTDTEKRRRELEELKNRF